MPWHLERRNGRYCVIKDSDGSSAGCHDSRAQAIKQQRALYANEGRTASMAYGDRPFNFFITDPRWDHVTHTLNLTAAAAPLKPPRAWFEIPEPDGPFALTITDEGQVFGHLATWDACHRGFLNGTYSECIRAPRSQGNYEQFYAGGKIETQEGDQIPVGRLTYDTSHAPLTADLRAAARHYDSTGAVGAFVRARDGEHGIWLAGAVRSDLSPEGLRDLRANPPSGDWRLLRSNDLELVASLAVPVPGFPITRSQLALAASANGGLEVTALILTGPTEADFEESSGRESKSYLRRRAVLTAAVLTTKKRKALSKSSFAIPEDRAYPIHDRAHAANALARSAGKPEAGRVKAAVCKRYPDMPACR